MSARKRGLQTAPEVVSRAGDDHPLAGREGLDEAALNIPITRVQPDPDQPRKHFDETALDTLTASIQKHGILQPLIVRKAGNLYYIVAGERRYRAALQADLTVVPCRIVSSDANILEIQLIENLQREDLPLLEEAAALQRLQTLRDASIRDLETATGKSRSYISRRLRLLDMPQDVQEMLTQAPQLFSHAESLAKIISEPRRRARIAALLQSGEENDTPPPRAPGRPLKPFSLHKKRSGGFDVVVKYRPGTSDRQSLIEELKKVLETLESEET